MVGGGGDGLAIAPGAVRLGESRRVVGVTGGGAA